MKDLIGKSIIKIDHLKAKRWIKFFLDDGSCYLIKFPILRNKINLLVQTSSAINNDFTPVLEKQIVDIYAVIIEDNPDQRNTLMRNFKFADIFSQENLSYTEIENKFIEYTKENLNKKEHKELCKNYDYVHSVCFNLTFKFDDNKKECISFIDTHLIYNKNYHEHFKKTDPELYKLIYILHPTLQYEDYKDGELAWLYKNLAFEKWRGKKKSNQGK